MGGGRAAATRLLENAYEAGIRHFDTAAYYGMGEAEQVLGGFLAGHRTDVTITTKAGIEPPKRTSMMRLAINSGRSVARSIPITKVLLRRATGQLIRAGAFAPADVVASLERSLRALRTDCVDFFLLHDYSVRDSPPDALAEVLVAAVKAGKVRSFGVGAPLPDVMEVVRRAPRLASVVQFENSAIRRNLNDLPPSAGQIRITHGALSESFRIVTSILQSEPVRARRWSESLDCDVSSPGVLASLMLDYAGRANVDGLVLFSTTDPKRMTTNARAIVGTLIHPHVAAAFTTLVADDLGQAYRRDTSPA
jgi:predicted oxidoreductase